MGDVKPHPITRIKEPPDGGEFVLKLQASLERLKPH
jgi:hypothetical protein